MKIVSYSIYVLFFFLILSCEKPEKEFNVCFSEIGLGWSKTSVNAPIFRKNSIVSANGYQFVSYYDSSATVVLAKRKIGESIWTLHRTQYKGNVYDAHNVICIMLDGDGFLHMSWDHHNNALNYCKSLEPFGLEMGEKEQMIGFEESVVSYPEFYRFSKGDLLFAYRYGGSGNGNLVLNRYEIKYGKWKRIQTNLIDGEGQRNAYWQMCIDENDRILVSWVWRENPDVASNHDMCFAKSSDGGMNWEKSNADKYQIPINIKTAEVVYPVSQNSNLINQTSMTTDSEGNAYIVTYFKAIGDSCTQYHLIYQNNNSWYQSTVSNRTLNFDLGGLGSRSVPISRPQIIIRENGIQKKAHVLYRDEVFDNKVCISSSSLEQLNWTTSVISSISVSRWEPSYDSELWKKEQKLNLYIQNVGQGQRETTVEMFPQMVSVLELNFN